MNPLTLSGITMYPLKGCRGTPLREASVRETGLFFDREWMIVASDGTFVSQRTHPELARIEARIERWTALVVRHSSQREPLILPAALFGGPYRDVTVHRDRVRVFDCGDRAAAWASAVLRGDYRVVRMGVARRTAASRVRPDATVSLADAFPLLVTSEASLADLNRRIVARGGATVRIDRFRPNLVISGCEPYAEDTWRTFRIGEVTFAVEKPCTRCSVTTVDQETAERGAEPLATLATYRKTPDGVTFGVNATPLEPGSRDAIGTVIGSRYIEVGMPVEVLETG